MPSTYNGSTAGRTAHETVAIPCPDGTDAPNAASVNNPLQALANFLAYLSANAALKGAIETGRFDGAAGDENAALESAGAITVRKLLWALTTPTKKVRFYQKSSGELEIVFNAKWRDAGPLNWLADAPTIGSRILDVSKLEVGATGIKVFRPAASVATGEWGDASWEDVYNLAADGHLRFVGTTTGTGGSNPAATDAVANELRAKNIAKCQGVARITGGTASLYDGFNVASVTRSGSSLVVAFAAAMADDKYTVQVTDTTPDFRAAGNVVSVPTVIVKSTTGFTIDLMDPVAGTPRSLASDDWQIDWVVFGKQDT